MTASRRRNLRALITGAVLAIVSLAASARAGDNRWTSIGPVGGGGRIHAVAVDPTNPRTVYVGYDLQGLWKTTDNGASWFQVGVGLTNWEFRALAIAPSDPSTLFAVTSSGVYRSTDSGENWLENFGSPYLVSIAIDPSNPTTAYVAGGACTRGSCS